jgi:hypothetical protein
LKHAPTGAAWSILQKALRGASSWGATSSRLSVAGAANETKNYENNNPKSNGGDVHCHFTSNSRAGIRL